jgi:hypothetical protein
MSFRRSQFKGGLKKNRDNRLQLKSVFSLKGRTEIEFLRPEAFAGGKRGMTTCLPSYCSILSAFFELSAQSLNSSGQ